MSYTKQTWIDGNAAYPATAARFGHMEDGIAGAYARVPVIDAAVDDDSTNNTPILQAAHDALPAAGGTILLLGTGTYKLVNEVVITKPCDILFPRGSIRQSVWGRQAFDVQTSDVTIEGKRIYSTATRDVNTIDSAPAFHGDSSQFLRASAVTTMAASRVTVRLKQCDGFVCCLAASSWDGASLDNTAYYGLRLELDFMSNLWAAAHVSHRIEDSYFKAAGTLAALANVTAGDAPGHIFYVAAADATNCCKRSRFIGDLHDLAGASIMAHIVSAKGCQECQFDLSADNSNGAITFANGAAYNTATITCTNDQAPSDTTSSPAVSYQDTSNRNHVIIKYTEQARAAVTRSIYTDDAATSYNETEFVYCVVNHSDSVSDNPDFTTAGNNNVVRIRQFQNIGAGKHRLFTISGGTASRYELGSVTGIERMAIGAAAANFELAFDPARVTTPAVVDSASTSKIQVAESRQALTYAGTITPDPARGRYMTLAATNSTNYTINAPANKLAGAIVFDIKNSSGGSMGTITWNAVFLLAGAFANPANTKRRTIGFQWDGTNWVETGRGTADI